MSELWELSVIMSPKGDSVSRNNAPALIAQWTHQQIDPSDKVSILGNVISILAISFGERM